MVKKTGDWKKTSAVIQNLTKESKAAVNLSLKRFGLKAEQIAKEHLSNQDLGWQSLKPLTLARKLQKGQSELTLIATSTYFQSISSWVVDDTALIGVKKTARSKDGKTELADIAAVHEFGSISRNIPARPLWQPTFTEAITWHNKNNQPAMILQQKLNKYK